MTGKRWLGFGILAVKVVIVTAMLAYVLRDMSWAELYENLVRISLPVALGCCGIVLVKIGLLALRWSVVTRQIGYSLPFRQSYSGSLIGIFFAQGLPASIGGDVFRIWWSRRHGAPWSAAVRIVLFDRLWGLVSLLLLMLWAVWHLSAAMGDILPLVILLPATGGLLTVGLVMAGPWRFGVSGLMLEIAGRVGGRVEQLVRWLVDLREMAFTLRTHFIQSVLVLVISLALHALTAIIGWLIADRIGAELGYLDCLAAMSISMLPAYLPISVGGWGVREAAIVTIFSLIGVPTAVSLLMSLGIGLAVLAVSLLGGLVWLGAGVHRLYHHDVQTIPAEIQQ